MSLPQVVLTSPNDNAVLNTNAVDLIFQPYTGANGYIVTVDEQTPAGWQNFYQEMRFGSSTIFSVSPLGVGKTYRWQIVAIDANSDYIAVSVYRTFQVSSSASAPVAQIDILRPARNSTVVLSSFSDTFVAEWTAVSGATQYRIWYEQFGNSQIPDFSNTTPILQTSTTCSLQAKSQPLNQSVTYAMRIEALNASNNIIGQSTIWSFYIVVGSSLPRCSFEASVRINNGSPITLNSATPIINLPRNAGNVKLIISTGNGCSYSVKSGTGETWLLYNSAQATFNLQASGRNEFFFTFSANSSNQRTKRVDVFSPTFGVLYEITFSQEASTTSPNCNYSIITSPASTQVNTSHFVNVSHSTTSITATVNTSPTCQWRMRQGVNSQGNVSIPDLNFISGTLGQTISFGANVSSASRRLVVEVLDPNNSVVASIYIIQAASPSPCTMDVNRSIVWISAEAQSGYGFMWINNVCQWRISLIMVSSSWIEVEVDNQRYSTVTPWIRGEKAYTIHYEANNSVDVRFGRIVFESAAGNVFWFIFQRPLLLTPPIVLLPNDGDSFLDTASIVIRWRTDGLFFGYHSFRIRLVSDRLIYEEIIPVSNYSYLSSSGERVYELSVSLSSLLASLPDNVRRSVYQRGMRIRFEYSWLGQGLDETNWTFFSEDFNQFAERDVVIIETFPPPVEEPVEEPEEEPEQRKGKAIRHIFPMFQTVCGLKDDALSEPIRVEIFEIVGEPPFDQVDIEDVEWTDIDGNALQILARTPIESAIIGRSALRSEPEMSTVEVSFSEEFPAEAVFERLLSKGKVTYYVRIIDDSSNRTVEGFLNPQISLSFLDFTHVVKKNSLSRFEENEVRIRRNEAFEGQLISSASVLKEMSAIDKTSRKISYSASNSSGKGLVDFLYRKFSRGEMVRISSVFAAILEYLNTESFLGQCKIFQSVSTSSFLRVLNANRIGYEQRDAQDRILNIDALSAFIYLDSFILSEHYGSSETRGKNGQLRDWSVERTRGLRNNDGEYGVDEEDYSFLNKTIFEIVSKLAQACGYDFFFNVEFDNVFTLKLSLYRASESSFLFAQDAITGVFNAIQNKIYYANDYLDDEESWKEDVESSLIFFEGIEVKEIGGKGMERPEGTVYNSIYEAGTVKSAASDLERFFGTTRESWNLILASLRIDADAYATNGSIKRKITLPFSRALTTQEAQFFARLIYRNYRYASSAVVYVQTGNEFEVDLSNAVRVFFFRIDDGVFYERDFANALAKLMAFHIQRVKKAVSARLFFELKDNDFDIASSIEIARGRKRRLGTVLSYKKDIGRRLVSGQFSIFDEKETQFLEEMPSSAEAWAKLFRENVSGVPVFANGVYARKDVRLYPPNSSGQFGDAWSGMRLGWFFSSEFENATLKVCELRGGKYRVLTMFAIPNDNSSGTLLTTAFYRILYRREGLKSLILSARLKTNPSKVRVVSVPLECFRGFLRFEKPFLLSYSDLPSPKSSALNTIQNADKLRLSVRYRGLFFDKQHVVVLFHIENGAVMVCDGKLIVAKNSDFDTNNLPLSSSGQFVDLGQQGKSFGNEKAVKIELEFEDATILSLKVDDETISGVSGYSGDPLSNSFQGIGAIKGAKTFPADLSSAPKVHFDYVKIERWNTSSSAWDLLLAEHFSYEIKRYDDKLFIDNFENFEKF